MARKGYSLGSLTDYVNTKFNITGGEITGSMNVQGVLNEKGQRVYSPNNKPTAKDLNVFNAYVARVTDQDWDTLTDVGSYRVENAAGANFPNIVGLPKVYNYGTLLVQNADNTLCQIYILDGSSFVYTRTKWQGNAWRPWSTSGNAGSTYINSSINLDDLSYGGTYNMYKSSGVVFTNAPSDFDYGTLQVIGAGRATNSFCTQILTYRNNGRQKVRTRNDGAMSWTPWVDVYSSSQKPSPADIGALPTTGGTMSGQIVFSSSTQQFQAPVFGNSDVNNLYVTTQGRWSYASNVYSTAPNNMPAGSNANGILTFNTHQGEYCHQLGLSSNGQLYHRYNKGSWAKLYTSNAKPTPSELGAVNKAGDTMTGQLIAPSFKAGTKILMGSGGNDVFLQNLTSNKYLQLGDDGIIRYDSKELVQMKGNGYVIGNNNRNYPRIQVNGTGAETIMYELHIPGKYASGLVLNKDNGNFEFWDTNGGGGWTRTLGYWNRGNGELYGLANANFNDVYIRSDARLKTGLQPLEGALDKVCSLKGYTYTKRTSLQDDTVIGVEAGIIAQDLEKVLPEAVNTAEDTQKTISNSGVNALLVEAIKELRAEVAELKRQLEAK